MKNIFATLFIITALAIAIKCEVEPLTDLTPETPHSDHFYFNSPAFGDALVQIDSVAPDTVYQIYQPDGLIDRSPFTYDRTWWTTDTFAFDPEDFNPVLDVLISTANAHEVVTSYPASDLAWIEVDGRIAYSKARTYWLIPYFTTKGQRFFIQITRAGTWWKQRYTANAIWMEAKRKVIKGDVS